MHNSVHNSLWHVWCVCRSSRVRCNTNYDNACTGENKPAAAKQTMFFPALRWCFRQQGFALLWVRNVRCIAAGLQCGRVVFRGKHGGLARQGAMLYEHEGVSLVVHVPPPAILISQDVR